MAPHLPKTQLSVNVNKVALLRNTRHGHIPCVIQAARLALDAGAAGITVHPRPDQRHIRPDDVERLANLLSQPPYAQHEFNIEGNPFEGDFMTLVEQAKPDQFTLVPDTPEAFTSNQGWDVIRHRDQLQDIVAQLHALGGRVSLFMDSDPKQIEQAAQIGADRIELYTEPYAIAYAAGEREAGPTFKAFKHAASVATDAGLGINAGHDLNLENLGLFLTIPNILEVSIGHALIADALELGMPQAVRAYRTITDAASW